MEEIDQVKTGLEIHGDAHLHNAALAFRKPHRSWSS